MEKVERLSEQDLDNLMRGYYIFFSKMYGYIRNDIEIDFVNSYYYPSDIDLADDNFVMTIKAVKSILNETDTKHFGVYDTKKNLIAMSRYRILDEELVISDIILLSDEDYMDKYEEEIVKYILNHLELEAEKLNLNKLFLEVPKRNKMLQNLVQTIGFDCKKEFNKGRYPTYLMDKDVVRSEEYGRNLSRK